MCQRQPSLPFPIFYEHYRWFFDRTNTFVIERCRRMCMARMSSSPLIFSNASMTAGTCRTRACPCKAQPTHSSIHPFTVSTMPIPSRLQVCLLVSVRPICFSSVKSELYILNCLSIIMCDFFSARIRVHVVGSSLYVQSITRDNGSVLFLLLGSSPASSRDLPPRHRASTSSSPRY